MSKIISLTCEKIVIFKLGKSKNSYKIRQSEIFSDSFIHLHWGTCNN